MSVRQIAELVYECDEPGCDNDIIDEVTELGNQAPYGWLETGKSSETLKHTCDLCATKKDIASLTRRVQKYFAKYGEVDVTVSERYIEVHVDRS